MGTISIIIITILLWVILCLLFFGSAFFLKKLFSFLWNKIPVFLWEKIPEDSIIKKIIPPIGKGGGLIWKWLAYLVFFAFILFWLVFLLVVTTEVVVPFFKTKVENYFDEKLLDEQLEKMENCQKLLKLGKNATLSPEEILRLLEKYCE